MFCLTESWGIALFVTTQFPANVNRVYGLRKAVYIARETQLTQLTEHASREQM